METSIRTMQILRLQITILGSLLGLLVWIANDYILTPSISHTYYTSAAPILIGTLIGFAFTLIPYIGYGKTDKETFSDNFLTTIAGLCAIGIAMFPTTSGDASGLDFYEYPYLFGHTDNQLINTLHFTFASIFFGILGYMSFGKFTLSPNLTKSMRNTYKILGLIVWLGMVVLALLKTLYTQLSVGEWFPNYVFWIEVVMLQAIAISWLLKSKLIIKN